ncbi:hypothetical protein ACQP25_44835 (plasmid) [Microtetraspora malaysiensis]|uniref:hypothetical protein n=1 Tax=Microtetraspora malaysiensis TaxID=161358 RepID=UPI003D8D2D14
MDHTHAPTCGDDPTRVWTLLAANGHTSHACDAWTTAPDEQRVLCACGQAVTL